MICIQTHIEFTWAHLALFQRSQEHNKIEHFCFLRSVSNSAALWLLCGVPGTKFGHCSGCYSKYKFPGTFLESVIRNQKVNHKLSQCHRITMLGVDQPENFHVVRHAGLSVWACVAVNCGKHFMHEESVSCLCCIRGKQQGRISLSILALIRNRFHFV